MESSEYVGSESQGFSDDHSVIIYCTPEKLTSIIHLKEALDTFYEMSLTENPVSCQLASELEAK